ncbi:MAG TPA: tetratricopeptide repeat protein, partial [Myxococcaceae bacterium]|nr:tetratricopeptide repeat protein [Myxococcaceae bacterium]
MATLLLALLVAAADPCGPVTPAPGGSASLGETYRRIGEDERSRGAFDTAAEAYRRALAQDPSNRRAREGLDALCRGPLSDAFQEGVRRMEAGDLDAALKAFSAVRAAGPSPPADLLAGICLYRKGSFASAVALLRSAEADPRLRDSARLYLGLIALRQGEGAEATRLLEGL